MARRLERLGLAVALALALLVGAFALLPAAAEAVRPGEGQQQGQAKKGGAKKGKEKAGPPAPEKEEESAGEGLLPSSSEGSTLGKELGSSGQVDPLSGLGIRNPVCDKVGQIRSERTRISCQVTGAPESVYPSSNFGFDVFISTGVTHPVGSAAAFFVGTVLNGLWLIMIFTLKVVLSLLGLAFGVNPFGDGATMSSLVNTVGRIYSRITEPWLSTLVVCGGIWFSYRSLVRRDVSGGVAGTLAAIALLVVGMWVVHQPRATVGQLAKISNDVALGTIGAAQGSSPGRPVGSYAEAMSRTWSRLVEVPFAGLNFSDVSWALSKPPAEAVERADEKFCEDSGTLALLSQLSDHGLEAAEDECAAFAARVYGKPRRVIDLYLRSSPNSDARSELWQYFDKDEADRYKSKVAAQGGDGVLTRLSMLALFAIGLLGAIILLAWLAVRLFTQAAIAFVLVLAAPFALFFPLLGDGGRKAFKTWGLTLLGAIVAKVVYAAFLSIVLLGIRIFGAVDGPVGSATGFLLSSAFTWAVLLKREQLVGWLKVGDEQRHGSAMSHVGAHHAANLGGRVVGAPWRGLKGVAKRSGQAAKRRARLGGEATRQTARDAVRDKGRGLADSRYYEAAETVAAYEKGGKKSPLSRVAKAALRERDESRRDPEGNPDWRARLPKRRVKKPTEESYAQAKQVLSRAEKNQKTLGTRFSPRDLKQNEEADRSLLANSRNPADHAHRVGLQRSEFEALRGPAREQAEGRIEQARERDVKRVKVAEEVPGRVVGRFRQTAERGRQAAEEVFDPTVGSRSGQLKGIRRERRLAASRRGLSRGR